MRQIVTNLVGNAIKFTDSGGVKVVLRPALRPRSRNCALDRGDRHRNRDPADRPKRSSSPFTQAESSTARRFGGTGLGLTISRRIRTRPGWRHRRRIAKSGQGKRVHRDARSGLRWCGVRLLDARRRRHARHDGGQAEQGAVWEFPPARVLVVDDGEANRELVRLVLRRSGCAYRTAENGRVGVGHGAARELRRHPHGHADAGHGRLRGNHACCASVGSRSRSSP